MLRTKPARFSIKSVKSPLLALNDFQESGTRAGCRPGGVMACIQLLQAIVMVDKPAFYPRDGVF